MPGNEDLYGTNAVTGTLEDRNVTIQTSNTTTFNTGDLKETEGAQEITTTPTSETTEQTTQKSEETTLTEEEQISQEAQRQAAADAEAAKVLSDKGVDFTALQQEYDSTGALSDQTYQQLEATGFPRSVVDAYIAGVEATADRFTQGAYKAVGGQEEYTNIAKFIGSLGKAHIDTYNRVVDSGDLMQLTAVLNGYKAQMVAKYGTANAQVLGNQPPAGTQPLKFASKAEMTTAINDPRYGRDAKYTKEVRMKIQNM